MNNNIRNNVRPKYATEDHDISSHYHSNRYGLEDRSDNNILKDISEIDISKLLKNSKYAGCRYGCFPYAIWKLKYDNDGFFNIISLKESGYDESLFDIKTLFKDNNPISRYVIKDLDKETKTGTVLSIFKYDVNGNCIYRIENAVCDEYPSIYNNDSFYMSATYDDHNKLILLERTCFNNVIGKDISYPIKYDDDGLLSKDALSWYMSVDGYMTTVMAL